MNITYENRIVTAVEPIEVVINGFPFIEITHPDFIVHAEYNFFPFLDTIYNKTLGTWKYKSVNIGGKFYAPKPTAK